MIDLCEDRLRVFATNLNFMLGIKEGSHDSQENLNNDNNNDNQDNMPINLFEYNPNSQIVHSTSENQNKTPPKKNDSNNNNNNKCYDSNKTKHTKNNKNSNDTKNKDNTLFFDANSDNGNDSNLELNESEEEEQMQFNTMFGDQELLPSPNSTTILTDVTNKVTNVTNPPSNHNRLNDTLKEKTRISTNQVWQYFWSFSLRFSEIVCFVYFLFAV